MSFIKNPTLITMKGIVMRVALCSSLMFASVLTAPAHAVASAGKFDILGIKVEDTEADVKRKLIAAGYTGGDRMGGGYYCGKTYRQMIESQVASKKVTVRYDQLYCLNHWRKGGSRLEVYYMLSPTGYVVDGINYDFETNEGAAALYGRLAQKFGPADRGYVAFPSSNWSDRVSGSRFSMSLRDSRAHLSMHAAQALKDGIVKAVSKELESRADRTPAPL